VGKKYLILNDFVNRAGLRTFQDFYLNVACPDKWVVLVGNVCVGTVGRVEVVWCVLWCGHS